MDTKVHGSFCKDMSVGPMKPKIENFSLSYGVCLWPVRTYRVLGRSFLLWTIQGTARSPKLVLSTISMQERQAAVRPMPDTYIRGTGVTGARS
ncbi:hypothetical protein D3C78_1351020 [compost metagenome]